MPEEEKKFEKLYILRQKLDKEIGYNYWKKYVASAFWSQISTPINLTITFLTAITTAQSQSGSLLPQSIYSHIAIASLVITTLKPSASGWDFAITAYITSSSQPFSMETSSLARVSIHVSAASFLHSQVVSCSYCSRFGWVL